MSDLKIAFDLIKAKSYDYDILFEYYRGEAPLKFSTERLRRAFDSFGVYFSQNWIGVVVRAVLDRLNLKGFDSELPEVNNKLDEIFRDNDLQLDAFDVQEAALVTGESFVIVDVIDGKPTVYYNDPRTVAIVYNPNNPKQKLYAAKLWQEEDNKYRLNLYYPNRTESYTSKSGSTSNSFILESTTANPYNTIPVFHFRINRYGIYGEVDKSAISIQDAINKLFSDLMVAAEFEAFKMRVFISQVDPGDVKVGPDKKLWLPANEGEGQPTSITEIGGSSLDNFLNPINDLATILAVTTRTPRHFLLNTGGVPSGEALIALESPLVKKVMQRQEAFAVTWIELMQFLLKLSGMEVNKSDILPIWGTVTTEQPLTTAQIIKTNIDSGIPLESTMRLNGYGEDEIAFIKDSTTTAMEE